MQTAIFLSLTSDAGNQSAAMLSRLAAATQVQLNNATIDGIASLAALPGQLSACLIVTFDEATNLTELTFDLEDLLSTRQVVAAATPL